MVAEASAIPPQGVTQYSAPGQLTPAEPSAASGDFRMFGKDGFTFWDFLDIINPLQHIPVVSTIYRAVTGDEIDPGSRIGGGTLFGGPIGAAVSVANVMVEHNTGRDMGEHVMAALQGGETPSSSDPVQTAAFTAAPAAAAAAPSIAPTMAPTITSLPAAAPFSAQGGARDVAGMSGIPIARGNAVAGYYRPIQAAPAPDLEILRATVATTPVAPAGADAMVQAIQPRSPALTTSAATAIQANVKSATPTSSQPLSASQQSAASKVTEATKQLGGSWVYEAMMQGLSKYESSARLGRELAAPAMSVVR